MCTLYTNLCVMCGASIITKNSKRQDILDGLNAIAHEPFVCAYKRTYARTLTLAILCVFSLSFVEIICQEFMYRFRYFQLLKDTNHSHTIRKREI